MEWKFEKISQDYFPRQFEYHPFDESLIFGTLSGEVCSVDLKSKDITPIAHLGSHLRDTILGLCWLKSYGNRFLSGSAKGRVCCVNLQNDTPQITDFPSFERLTSIHSNCTNSLLLLSGYSQGISLYDLQSGSVVRTFSGIHSDHINISRFCNTSPHIFSTSSFDGTIKTWDLRMPGPPSSDIPRWNPEATTSSCGPINTLKCSTGVVTIHFSSDDNFLLASALDNEINQFSFADGRLNFRYNIPSTGSEANFTRGYFSASGRYTLTGACEESTVKFLCSYTGEMLETVDVYPRKRDKSLYIQSLRGSSRTDSEFCVLANYHEAPFRELILAKCYPSFRDKIDPVITSSTKPLETEKLKNREEKETLIENEDFSLSGILSPISQMHSTLYLKDLFELRKSLGFQNYFPRGEVEESDKATIHENEIISILYQDAIYSKSETISVDESMNLLRSLLTARKLISFHDSYLPLYHHFDHISNILQNSNRKLMIHSYILFARCPSLYQLSLTQPLSANKTIDITSVLSNPQQRQIFSLFLDYLYIGYPAINFLTVKYYTLLLLFSSLMTEDEKKAFIQFLCATLPANQQPKSNESGNNNVSNEEDDEQQSQKGYPAKASASDKTALKNSLSSVSPEIQMILKLCNDCNLWRQSPILLAKMTSILMDLYEIGRKFQVPEFSRKCENLLISSLSPLNCISILDWAMKQQQSFNLFSSNSTPTSLECIIKYMANHADIIQLPNQKPLRDHFFEETENSSLNYSSLMKSLPSYYPNIVHLIQELIQENSIELLTKSELSLQKYRQILEREKSKKQFTNNNSSSNPSIASFFIDDEDSEGNEELKKLKEKSNQLASLTASEEMPFLSVSTKNHSSAVSSSSATVPSTKALAVTLPKIVGHSNVVIGNNSIFYFGGMNRERFFSLSRVLSYDVKEDRFRYLQTEATKGPVNANLNAAFVLQKRNPTMMVMMGGKLKLSPQQKDSNEILFSEKMRNYENHNFIWNLGIRNTNHKNLSSSSLTNENTNLNSKFSSNSNPLQKSFDQIVEDAVNGSHDANLDYIFEFHIPTLTWNRKSIQHLTITKNNNRRQQQRTIFNPRPDPNEISAEDLSTAFRKRLAQSMVPIYSSDISYRCANCLFRDQTYRSDCNCHFKTMITEPESTNEENVTWSIQFGGFCILEDAIKDDVHVLICKKNSAFSSNTFRESELPQTTKQNLLIADDYIYQWTKLKVHLPGSMESPSARFGHKGVFIPPGAESASSTTLRTSSSYSSLSTLHPVPVQQMGRIFFFGGVRTENFEDIFLSLRVNSLEMKERYHIEEDLSWETYKKNSPFPRNRHDHSFTYVPDGNFCLLFGGMVPTIHGHQSLNDLWALHWSFTPSNTDTNTSDLQILPGLDLLTLRWEKINAHGIPPSLRSRHTAAYLPTGDLKTLIPASSSKVGNSSSSLTAGNQRFHGSLFIFGGIDESTRNQNQQNQNLPPELLFDEKQSDSIISILQWNYGSLGQQSKSPRSPLTSASPSSKKVFPTNFLWVSKTNSSSSSSSQSNRFNFENSSSSSSTTTPTATSSSGTTYTNSKFLNIDCCPEDFIPLLPNTLSSDLKSLLFLSENPPTNDSMQQQKKKRILPILPALSNQSDQAEIALPEPDFTFQYEIPSSDLPPFGDNDEDIIIPEVEGVTISSRIKQDSSSAAEDELTNQMNQLSLTPPSSSYLFQSFSSFLSQRCSVIQRMLESEMIESQTKLIHVDGQETNFYSLEIFFQFLLSDLLSFQSLIPHNTMITTAIPGSEERNLLPEIIGLLQLAKFYSLNSLVKKCEGLLLSLITETTVMEILQYADLMNLELLTMACYHFIFRNIDPPINATIDTIPTFVVPITHSDTLSTLNNLDGGQAAAAGDDDEGTNNNITPSANNNRELKIPPLSAFPTNLAFILREDICNQDISRPQLLENSHIEGEEHDLDSIPVVRTTSMRSTCSEQNLSLVESFQLAPKEVKQKFREFALQQVHVYLYDVWRSQNMWQG